MANKERGYVRVDVGGKACRLKFDINAMCEIEDRFDMDFLRVLKEKTLDARTVRGLLWAAMLHDNPEITEAEVGSMMLPSDFLAVKTAITQAFAAALSGASEDGASKKKPSGTGRRSSGSRGKSGSAAKSSGD